jgi:hypothetical protein
MNKYFLSSVIALTLLSCGHATKSSDQEYTDPLERANFIIDLSQTDLKFTRYIANMFVYSTDSVEIPGDHPNGSGLMIGQLESNNETIEDLKSSSLTPVEYLKEKGSLVNIIDQGQTKIDGLSAYFIAGTSISNGDSVNFYIISTASKDNYFTINAMAYENRDANIEILKKAIKSFQIK